MHVWPVMENTGDGVQRGAQKGSAMGELGRDGAWQPVEHRVASRAARGGGVGLEKGTAAGSLDFNTELMEDTSPSPLLSPQHNLA